MKNNIRISKHITAVEFIKREKNLAISEQRYGDASIIRDLEVKLEKDIVECATCPIQKACIAYNETPLNDNGKIEILSKDCPIVKICKGIN